MEEDDIKYGTDTSDWKKFTTSVGYGALEFIPDYFVTGPLMNRAFKGFAGGRKTLNQGWNGLKEYNRKHF